MTIVVLETSVDLLLFDTEPGRDRVFKSLDRVNWLLIVLVDETVLLKDDLVPLHVLLEQVRGLVFVEFTSHVGFVGGQGVVSLGLLLLALDFLERELGTVLLHGLEAVLAFLLGVMGFP